MRHAVRAAACVGLVVFLSALNAAHAQVSPTIFSVGPDQAVARSAVTIRAELRQLDVIERLAVLYRPFGSSEFAVAEMDIGGSAATATLPAEVVLPPFLEYYIAIVRRDGTMESFPVSQTPDPFLLPPPNTLRLPVRAADEPAQILFLSPETTEVLDAVTLMTTSETNAWKANFGVRRAEAALLYTMGRDLAGAYNDK